MCFGFFGPHGERISPAHDHSKESPRLADDGEGGLAVITPTGYHHPYGGVSCISPRALVPLRADGVAIEVGHARMVALLEELARDGWPTATTPPPPDDEPPPPRPQ